MAKSMEEFQKVLNDIRTNLDDTAKVTELLESVSLNYSEMTKENNTLSANNEKLIKDNDNLRNVNMDLFLKVGNQRAESQSQENQSQENQSQEDRLSFDNLFDENGNLK